MDNDEKKEPEKITCPLLEQANEKIVEMERRHAEDIKALQALLQ